MKKLDAVALLLAVVGALNWGLVALAEFDLVAAIAGLEFGRPTASRGSSTAWLGSRVLAGGSFVRARPRAGPPGRERRLSTVAIHLDEEGDHR